ncbi:MAG: type I restriction enzyme HsdR N-terminal domain-containing protein [Bacteroidales bacterium]|nr:type I restriction enzyme HsdR N-terminal domain-containing protein [Bacteroidales bacterium]MDD3859350.1 type I restriction enzyme HsdR N-terminal domain-containing protein [Bacteroidales bacterium]
MTNPFNILGFKTYEFKLKSEAEKNLIYDEFRKTWIVCTPEEWVRQNLLKFLVSEFGFPVNLVSVEKSLSVAGRKYRFDALIYNKEFKPLMIIECKAPSVSLKQEVFDQIWNYNYKIGAPYFFITNGLTIVMGECVKNGGVKFFEKIKSFNDLIKE